MHNDCSQHVIYFETASTTLCGINVLMMFDDDEYYRKQRNAKAL